VEITLAKTEAEKREAYRLRYAVFTQEGGDRRYCVDESGEYRDALDDRNTTHILLARDAEGVLMATTRLALRSAGPFLHDSLYDWDALTHHTGIPAEAIRTLAGLADRGAVSPRFRGQRLYRTLVDHSCQLAHESGLKVVLGAVEQSNHAPAHHLNSLGFVTYSKARLNGATYLNFYREIK